MVVEAHSVLPSHLLGKSKHRQSCQNVKYESNPAILSRDCTLQSSPCFVDIKLWMKYDELILLLQHTSIKISRTGRLILHGIEPS